MDSPSMDLSLGSWDFVIKVKYGDTLKRFNGCVSVGLMDHDMNKLRNKIVNLFKLNQDPELVLTYVDEDGELVTLENDDELRDAVINQHLNPLRINVQSKSNSGGGLDLKPEILSSATSRPPQVEQSSQVSSVIEEALRSVPEPFRSTVDQISHELVKAASTSPALTALVETLSKLGISNISQPPSTLSGESSGISFGATAQSNNLKVNGESKANASDYLQKRHETVNLSEDGLVKNSSINLNVGKGHSVRYPYIDDLLTSVCPSIKSMDQNKESEAANRNVRSFMITRPVVAPEHTVEQSNSHKSSLAPSNVDRITNLIAGNINKQVPIGMSSSTLDAGIGFPGAMPVNAFDNALNSDLPFPSGFHPTGHPYRRFQGHHDSLLHTFHRGVQCDGCGMHPIIGPRFKSKVKDDYDLCNICYSQMGNEADYIRIDRAHPLSHRMFKELNSPLPRRRFPPGHFHGHFHGVGLKPARAKLESRFIQDVTVLDGTMIPPSTPFTKIWRMRNNGNTKWPCGTQLVWVGGDQFANRNSVQLEIQLDGFPVDEEIDVAVDFTSPSMTGRYVSYWRLASPSGQKFGQRVWVLIQVDNSRPNSAAGNFYPEINLNLPPESSNRNGLGVIDVNAEPLDGSLALPSLPDELVEPFVNEIPTSTPEPASLDVISKPIPTVTPSEPYGATVIDSSSEKPLVDVASFSEMAKDDKTVEQTLLKELEEMGFKQIDLNKEILRQNDYDLEQSVDDLCDYAEWDPLLAELQEMGFSDTTKNKQLLTKYDGSIKRVVMDLIAQEKAE